MINRKRSLFIVLGLAVSALALVSGWLPLPVVSALPLGNAWTVGGPCGTTIQACINYAANGDTVFVPAGTYNEWLWLNKPVSLIGSGAETTIVHSSDSNRPTLSVYGSPSPPANITPSTVISGFTFTGGRSTTSGGGIALHMLLMPTIQNVRVTGNQAEAGGGIGVDSGSSAVLSNIVITGNVATGANGFGGGGLFIWGDAVQLNNVLVADNQDGSGHGQIEVVGGMVYLRNGTIASTGLNPAAGLILYGGTAFVNNTIVTSQTIGLNVRAGSLIGDCNLFYHNITNTNTAHGRFDVFGDPAFVDAGRGNYRLLDRSAAIDRCPTTAIISDFDGDARPLGAGYDIGIDEHRRPVITVTSPSATRVISSSLLTVTGLTVPLDQIGQVDISTDNGGSWSTAVGTTTFSYTWTVPVEDGVTHMLLARGTDRTHNLGWSDPVTITVDRIAPQASITAPSLGQIITQHAYTLTVTASDGTGVARIQLSTDNGGSWHDAAQVGAAWSYLWPIPDEDGVSHLLRVAAQDVAGNFSAPPASIAVFVDNVPPVIQFNNVLTTGVTTILSDTFTVTGSSTGALTTTLALSGGAEIPVEVVDRAFTQTLTALVTGTYTLRGLAVDAGGNTAEVTATLVITPYAPTPRFVFLPLVFRNFDPLRDRYEIDDTAAAASAVTTDGVPQRHNFYPANDVDWVRFDAAPGTYILNTSSLAPNTDTVFRLYAGNGVTLLAQNDDCSSTTRASCLTWTVATSSTLYLQIAPYDASSIGPERWYDVAVVRQ